MSEFLQRLRQRKLVQWTLGYAAVAWVMLEVVSTVSDMWGWSAIVGRLVFVFLAIGLGWAVVLAWYHGERGQQRVSVAELGLLGALLVVGVFTAVIVFRSPDAPEPALSDAPAAAGSDPRSLVVLPFTDMSPDGGREYLGDGIAETLISGLGRIEELRVVARTSAFQFKGQGLDIREIARRLGAGSVLEGSVVQIGDRVRITANLVDAETGLDLWSQRFDKEMDAADLFVMQDEVAQTILTALEVELAGDRPVVSEGTRNPAAQKAYYLGMHHWSLRTTEDIALATDYFNEAVAADSAYADAWAGLALSYVLHIPSEYDVPGLSPTQALDLAEMTALKAIELDPTLAEPHAALGWSYKRRVRPDDAEREFRLGIEKNPGYATAHHWLADSLLEWLRTEEALEEIQIAETLDPVSQPILVEKAQTLLALGRFDEANAQIERSLRLFPDAALVNIFAALFAMVLDDWDEAARRWEHRLALGGDDPDAIRAFTDALRDPASRPQLLRDVVEGRGPNFTSLIRSQSVAGPHFRFIAITKLDGAAAALEDLATTLQGPDRNMVYGPLMPALMGPEVLATPEGRRAMELLLSIPEG
jgi:TolB-like protein/Tfp pilus assembly protein PilF